MLLYCCIASQFLCLVLQQAFFSFTVKPLYYGDFGSYAPSYDSTFANLTKEESDLVYQTYGDETCVQYAER